MTALVLSNLDYCNALLSGIRAHQVHSSAVNQFSHNFKTQTISWPVVAQFPLSLPGEHYLQTQISVHALTDVSVNVPEGFGGTGEGHRQSPRLDLPLYLFLFFKCFYSFKAGIANQFSASKKKKMFIYEK